MMVLAWRGHVRVVVLGSAAGQGCYGTVTAVGAGGAGAVGVPSGFGSGVVRRGWAWVPVGCRALLAGALVGPLTCPGLLGLVGVGGG